MYNLFNLLGFFNALTGSTHTQNNNPTTCSFIAQSNWLYLLSDSYNYLTSALSIDDGQATLLAKLLIFLDTLTPDQPKQLEKLKKALSKGHCHGLSIVHNAMERIGKLQWYEAALSAITNWDEKESSLNKEILLPDANEDKPIKFSLIFFRVINYIVTYQVGNSNSKFRLENSTCLNILSSEGKYLEILDDNKILTVQHSIKFSGYFSNAKLRRLLNEECIQNSICLILSTDHAIRIGYKGNNTWLVYDSNYPHGILTPPIHKTMNKEQLIIELLIIQGNSLTIEIAHLKPTTAIHIPLIEYTKMLEEELLDILQGYGLHQITREAPKDHFPTVLKLVEKESKYQIVFTRALGTKSPKVYQGDGKYESMMDSVLQNVARSCPQYLDRTINIALQSDIGEQALRNGFKEFAEIDSNGWSTLLAVAQEYPNYFPRILHLYLNYTDYNPQLIGQVLSARLKKRNVPSLLYFDQSVEEQVQKMLHILTQSPNAHRYLLSALATECSFKRYKLKKEGTVETVLLPNKSEKKSGIEWLIFWKSSNLSEIMALITTNLTELKVGSLLDYPNLLYSIAEHQPNALVDVFHFIETSKHCQQKLVAEMRRQIESPTPHKCLLFLFKEPLASCVFSALARIGFGFVNVLNLLAKQDQNGVTMLHHLLDQRKNNLFASLSGVQKLLSHQTNRFQMKKYLTHALIGSMALFWITQSVCPINHFIYSFLLLPSTTIFLASLYQLHNEANGFIPMHNKSFDVKNELMTLSQNPNGLFAAKESQLATKIPMNLTHLVINLCSGIGGRHQEKTREYQRLLRSIVDNLLEEREDLPQGNPDKLLNRIKRSNSV